MTFLLVFLGFLVGAFIISMGGGRRIVLSWNLDWHCPSITCQCRGNFIVHGLSCIDGGNVQLLSDGQHEI